MCAKQMELHFGTTGSLALQSPSCLKRAQFIPLRKRLKGLQVHGWQDWCCQMSITT